MKVTYKELPEKAAEGYGITRWGNAQEIKQSLTDLTDKNIYSIPEEKYTRRRSAQFGVQQAIPNVHGEG